MPKLKLTVDKLEDVDEKHRDLYVERDGKYELDADGVPDLRTALKTANAEARNLRLKYKDIDPDEVKQTKAELEELRTKAAGPEQLEALKNQLVTAHGKEKQKLQARIDSLTAAYEDTAITSAATVAIADAKGAPALLLPHVRKSVRLADVDGRPAVQVVDDKGNPRVNKDGQPLTIKDLVEEMRADTTFGRAFDGSNAGGAGSGSSGGGGGGAAGKKRSAMSVTEKSAYIAAHGSKAFFDLPA